MATVHYSECPVCNSRHINPLLTVKDHSVSGEEFVIWQCSDCTLRFTQDVPDEDSIAAYYASPNYISHSDTQKGAVNKLYQRVRKLTLQQKAALIIRYTKPQGRVLDVGAGTGAFLAVMKEAGWDVSGIEPDAGARSISSSAHNLSLQEPSVLEGLLDKSYDAVTLWHVLEHIHTLHDYLDRLKNLLTPGGKFFIAVPNYTSADAGTYRTWWAAYDAPRHLYHFTPTSVEVLMKRHGLKVVAQKPMWFDAFYISLLSSKYKNGSTSWIGAGLTGLRSNLEAVANKERCSSLVYVVAKA